MNGQRKKRERDLTLPAPALITCRAVPRAAAITSTRSSRRPTDSATGRVKLAHLLRLINRANTCAPSRASAKSASHDVDAAGHHVLPERNGRTERPSLLRPQKHARGLARRLFWHLCPRSFLPVGCRAGALRGLPPSSRARVRTRYGIRCRVLVDGGVECALGPERDGCTLEQQAWDVGRAVSVFLRARRGGAVLNGDRP